MLQKLALFLVRKIPQNFTRVRLLVLSRTLVHSVLGTIFAATLAVAPGGGTTGQRAWSKRVVNEEIVNADGILSTLGSLEQRQQ